MFVDDFVSQTNTQHADIGMYIRHSDKANEIATVLFSIHVIKTELGLYIERISHFSPSKLPIERQRKQKGIRVPLNNNISSLTPLCDK
jgi:hypothetical protein